MKLVLESAARADLVDIRNYLVREAGVRTARAVLESVRDRLRILETWPEVGPLRANLGAGRRILVCPPYVAIYTIKDQHVRVLHVLHGARDIEAIMADDRD